MSGDAARLVVAAGIVWLDDARVLVHRRPDDARHGAGRLELPGGKVEPGESPRAALARELGEEWGPAAAQLPIGPVADVLHHVYPPPGPEVILVVHHVDGRACDPARLTPLPGLAVLAYATAALDPDAFLAADRSLVVDLRERRVGSPYSGAAG